MGGGGEESREEEKEEEEGGGGRSLILVAPCLLPPPLPNISAYLLLAIHLPLLSPIISTRILIFALVVILIVLPSSLLGASHAPT